jgi:hypothetical protein
MMNAGSGRDAVGVRHDWMADSFRVTFFVSRQDAWPKDLLNTLVNQPAELEQTSKRGAMVTTLEATKVGAFQVNVVAQPARLDVNVSVAPIPEDPDVVVKPTHEFKEILETIAAGSINLSPFVRLAVAASLFRPCPSKPDVYRLVQARFPCLGIDPENSDDLVIQMNHPQNSGVTRINRIERWSYGLFERIDIPVLVAAGPEAGQVGRRLEGVKLDLDYNTAVQADRTFDATASQEIFKRLINSIYEKIQAE